MGKSTMARSWRLALLGRVVCLGLSSAADDGELECPNSCSGHGKCIGGVCDCNIGYGHPPSAAGETAVDDCSMTILAHGYIVNGTVTCKDGYTGPTCDQPPKPVSKVAKQTAQRVSKGCPNDCRGNGVCDDGLC